MGVQVGSVAVVAPDLHAGLWNVGAEAVSGEPNEGQLVVDTLKSSV
jgi:hypothetical protein